MGRTYLQTVAVICIVLFSGCKKENCDCVPPPTIPPEAQKVFLVCEGSYGNGNAALDLYLPSSDVVLEDVYKAHNNGKALGDVFQSITRIESRYYLCINNSDKVIALDTGLGVYAYVNVPKPRYIVPVNSTKMYVSSLFTNKVFIVDPIAMTNQGSISLPAKNTEGMLLIGDKVYISAWDTASDKVYVVNSLNDQLEDSFSVAGRAPSEILNDKDGNLWILSGNVAKGKQAYWTKVDINTKQTLASYPFPASADPIRPVMNATQDTIYFIEVNYSLGTQHNGIFRMSIYDQQIPSAPFIPAQQGQYFWALGISPYNGDIYVGDPKGFTQKSNVMIYNTAGEQKKQFSAGVGIGHFYFSY